MKKFEREGVTFIASGDNNHEIKIWNPSLAGNELITTLLGHFQGGITSLIYHNDYLVSSSKDSSLKVWNLEELKCVQTINHDQYSKNIIIIYFYIYKKEGGGNFDIIITFF